MSISISCSWTPESSRDQNSQFRFKRTWSIGKGSYRQSSVNCPRSRLMSKKRGLNTKRCENWARAPSGRLFSWSLFSTGARPWWRRSSLWNRTMRKEKGRFRRWKLWRSYRRPMTLKEAWILQKSSVRLCPTSTCTLSWRTAVAETSINVLRRQN